MIWERCNNRRPVNGPMALFLKSILSLSVGNLRIARSAVLGGFFGSMKHDSKLCEISAVPLDPQVPMEK